MGFSKRLKNEFETGSVSEPSVVEPLNILLYLIHLINRYFFIWLCVCLFVPCVCVRLGEGSGWRERMYNI